MASLQHTVLVGAGIVGLATASALVQRGQTVTIVDPEEPGTGCSYGNAGCFSLASIVPVGMPGMWRKVPGWLADPGGPLSIPMRYAFQVSPWVIKLLRHSTPDRVRRIAGELHSLLSPSLKYWRPLARWANVPELIQQNGWAVAYESEAAFHGDRLGWHLRAERGIQIEYLAGHAVRELEPALAQKFTHLVYLPEQAQCTNPFRLSQALAARLRNAGAQFVKASVHDFAFQDGKIAKVLTNTGPLDADNVVIAAGAFSKSLSRLLGDDVPLETERGYHTMVHTQQPTLRRPVMSAEGKFFASPMEEGLRFAGSVELGGLKLPPNLRRAEILLNKGRAMLPELEVEQTSQWMGYRPSLPDSKPVIGSSRKASNAYYAFGHGHVGLTAAAATGEIVAALMNGELPPIDMAPFSPSRF